MFCQQSQRERQQKEAGENDIERVELRGQQAAARQECWHGRETVANTTALLASDATAHQNVRCN